MGVDHLLVGFRLVFTLAVDDVQDRQLFALPDGFSVDEAEEVLLVSTIPADHGDLLVTEAEDATGLVKAATSAAEVLGQCFGLILEGVDEDVGAHGSFFQVGKGLFPDELDTAVRPLHLHIENSVMAEDRMVFWFTITGVAVFDGSAFPVVDMGCYQSADWSRGRILFCWFMENKPAEQISQEEGECVHHGLRGKGHARVVPSRVVMVKPLLLLGKSGSGMN